MHNNETECEICRIDDESASMMLDSKVEQKLVFKIKPKSPGQLIFTGIQYRLTTPDIEQCDTIELKQDFHIRGPRLSKTTQHKKSVMYGDDLRLTVKVIDQAARLDVSLGTGLPPKCLANEIITLSLTIKNHGNGSAKNVWINHNQGDRIRTGEANVHTESVYKINKSSLSGPTFIGDIESNGQKIIPVQMLMSGQGKRLLEIVAYTESKFILFFRLKIMNKSRSRKRPLPTTI